MRQKISVVRGTSNTFHIALKDADGNDYTLLSGERLIFGVKHDPPGLAEEPLILKVVTQLVDGLAQVELEPEDTAGLEYGRYCYDVGLESGEDYYCVIGASPFYIAPNVTKRGDGA